MMLFQFVFSFLLMYVLFPLIVVRFHKDDSGWIDKLFIVLTHSTLFYIIVVHAFVALRLYETFSVYFATLAGLVVADRFLNPNWPRIDRLKMMTTVYDVADGPGNWKKFLRNTANGIRTATVRGWQGATDHFRSHWAMWIAIAGTLGYAAYVRFRHSFEHLYFGSSDPYVHMRFTKYLSDNTLFGEGIYPYGYPAVISALHKFFNLDPYVTLRYIGPLGGMLLVLSVFFAVRKIIGSVYPAIFVGMFIYAVYAGLPVFVWRQISALSMEYATVFLLPGIAFLICWLRNKGARPAYLILAGECLAIAVFMHAYTAFTLVIAYVVVYLCFWRTAMTRKQIVWFSTVMTASGIVGSMPLIVAFLTIPVGDLSYVEDNIQGTSQVDWSAWPQVFLNADAVTLALLLAGAAFLVYRIVAAARRRGRGERPRNEANAGAAATLLLFFVFFLIFEADSFGLPSVFPADRFGVSFALVAAAACGVAAYAAFAAAAKSLPLRARSWAQYVSVSLVAALVLVTGSVQSAPAGDRYQYDDSVQVYLNIKRELPSMQWTIVSTQEENPFVFGYGFHWQLWEFARTIDSPEGKTLRFDTPSVLVFVEKVPLGSDREVTEEEASEPFPEFNNTDLTDFYYRDVRNRRILQSKMFQWAERYMREHDNTTIFYDSPVLRVYRIQNENFGPIDLLQ